MSAVGTTAGDAQGSAAAPGDVVGLKRALGTRDVVLFNLVAVLGIRWFSTAAKSGPSSITLWVLAALLFFIPEGLAVAELSSRYPRAGGIYAWTKQRFGEGHAFLCGWCYWIVNVLYYPQLLLSTAVIATYVFGMADRGLGENWWFVLPTTLIALWLAACVNIAGLSTGKWLQNVGGLASFATGGILILVGVIALLKHGSVTAFSWRAMTPTLASLPTVNLWATIAFAFTGMELGPTLGAEIKNPRRTLPRAVYITTPLIASLYILGTASLLWLMAPPSVNIVSGFLQGIELGAGQIGHWLWWLAPAAAALYVLGNVGCIGAWLSGPARVAMVIGLDRYFPAAFGRIHPRWGTPYVAIGVQALIATILLLLYVLGKGTTVQAVYLLLQDTQTLVYFVPFIYLFVCFLVEPARAEGVASLVPGGAPVKVILGVAGLFVTVVAMGLAIIPPDTGALLFEIKVVGGALFFVGAGGCFYWIAARRAVRAARIVAA